MSGPLSADFSVKIRYTGAADSVVQFIFYQPIIHRWRETDFFPCSASCGGGYQLTSAECYDMRSGRIVADQYCHYYPENVKPKPRLQECNMDPCLASDGYKQIMPYDLYHPLPRWETTPWTACSSSCGGGIQSRTVSCVEEDMQGQISTVEEWKCMYTPKMPLVQPCNIFDCPKWLAQEWSPCTVTCGHGLRYRVVLCIDHRGIHTGGCSPKTKPHIKEECTVHIPCYKMKEKLPVEAKLPWYKQAQELEEATAVSEEPSFIPEPWSPCSVSCGVGVQQRTLKCQVLLAFAQTIADLPLDECEGPKPANQRTCYSGPCNGEALEFNPDEEEQEYGGFKDIDELYDWEYEGFSECSESCGGGVQEAIVVCLNKQMRVSENLCVTNRRPPPLLKSCNLEACPPRWEIGNWSLCSLTCGVGLQTRDIFCSHLLSRETNETLVLGDDFCPQPKPTLVQACNRFDCPPSWYTTDWKPCSQSCGGGLQTREVLCKQRMSDGSILELPETFCSSEKPPPQELCQNEDCPAEWYLTDWSKCSVSCGEGTQIQGAVCRKKVTTGEYVLVNSSVCAELVLHQMTRPCSLAPCTRPRLRQKTNPQITGLKKMYIQMKKQKKLQFVVGGYAYLLPKTSLVLRCPVRRFRKPQIIWEKDGKHLISSEHVTVAPHGYIKIHHLKPSDTGVYTCMAGPSQEYFVIKLIGEYNKIIYSQASRVREEGAAKKIRKNDGYNHPEKQQNAYLFNRSKSDKQMQMTDPSNVYDNFISHLLALKVWPDQHINPSDPQESFERNISSEEDHGLEHPIPDTFIIDVKRLDDLIQTISQQPAEFSDNSSRHLLLQLSHEFTRSHIESHEPPVFKTDHKQVSYGTLEHSSYKPVSGFSSSWRSSSMEAEVFEPHEISPAHPLRKPVILRKISAAQHFSASEVVTHIGQTVALASGTLSVLLHCEAGGNPKPLINWAKNGEEVKYNNRILLKSDDSLQILEPVEADVGFYTCNATNSLGSASVSIAITLAGKPLIKTSRTVVINMDASSITVDVGSMVKTIRSTNVTIHCQVAGLPEVDVTWYRNKSRLHHVSHHTDASLFLGNVSCTDQGLYTCKAVNVHGEVSSSTELQVVEPPLFTISEERLMMLLAETGPEIPSVLTSFKGNSLLVNTGGTALIGCPVKGYYIPKISWFYGTQPLNNAIRLAYDILEGGQILRLTNLSKDHQGEYSCVITNTSNTLLQKAFLSVAALPDYQWSVIGLLPCTVSCGNRGIQHQQLRCVLDKQEVNASHCRDKPRLPIKPIPCNRRDCSPRWMVTSWSSCSQTCGGGVQTRRVTCQKLTGTGISVPVSNDICAISAKRPVDSQSCSKQLCVEWTTSAWGQCHGQCTGPRMAVQHRQVHCQTRDRTFLSPEQCQVLPRPLSTRNCWSDSCSVHWRVSPWTLCTTTCGSYGFQSRRVECVHHRTGKLVQDHLCSWRPRPSNWQRCNMAPCENGMGCKGWIY